MTSLFKPGQNCWRLALAHGIKVHIEPEDYYRALYDYIPKAENYIYIAGWDFDFRTNLVRDNFSKADLRDLSNEHSQIGELFEDTLSKKPNLQIYLLIWSHPSFYATDREVFAEYKAWLTMSHRIHFMRDDQHPFGGSQHQKFVVIDDKLAFVGGLDISGGRWDSREHRYQDPRRNDHVFKDYGPYRDVQMQVQGPIVEDLTEVFEERWQRVTDIKLPEKQGSYEYDLFRSDYEFTHKPVAIARTHPKFRKEKPIREIERLYWDLIAIAKEEIFLENQYLASEELVKRLCERLSEPNGPRVTLILPGHPMDLLEEKSMGALKSYMVRMLKDAAHDEDRVEVFYPQSGRGPGSEFKVHSKVMIVDDCYIRVGSSNLNNRSLGLDRELDLCIGSDQFDPRIRKIKINMLATFISIPSEQIEQELNQNPNINLLAKKHTNTERRLVPVKARELSKVDEWVRGHKFIDTKKTTQFERLLEQVFLEDAHRRWVSVVLSILGAFLFAGIVSLTIFWTNAYDMILGTHLPRTVETLSDLQNGPSSWILITLVFGVLATLFLPLNLFILAAATIYTPMSALTISLLVAIVAGSLAYLIGKYTGPKLLRRVSKNKFHRLTNLLTSAGWMTVAIIRLIPISPYNIANIACGALQIRFRDFIFGSIAGLLPGIIVITLFQSQLIAFVNEPTASGAILVFAIVIAAFLFLRMLRRRFLGGIY